MVDIFCPTVGTVFCAMAGAFGEVLYKDLMADRSVVFPALSKPRRSKEYSGHQACLARLLKAR